MRLTFDFDVNQKEFKKLFKIIEAVFVLNQIDVFKTRKGYHVIIYDVPLNEKECLILRSYLGDDWRRIHIDIIKPKPYSRQVLWTKKNGFVPKLIKRVER